MFTTVSVSGAFTEVAFVVAPCLEHPICLFPCRPSASAAPAALSCGQLKGRPLSGTGLSVNWCSLPFPVTSCHCISTHSQALRILLPHPVPLLSEGGSPLSCKTQLNNLTSSMISYPPECSCVGSSKFAVHTLKTSKQNTGCTHSVLFVFMFGLLSRKQEN